MKYKRTATAGIALGLLLAGSEPVLADGAFPGGRSWAVGFGVVTSPSPFVDHPTRVWPVPVIAYAGKRLQVVGSDMNYKLIDKPLLQLGLSAGVRYEGFDPEKSDALDDMSERKAAFEMGVRVQSLGAAVDYRGDVSGVHKGHHLRLSVSRSFPIQFGAISPNVSATWKSESLNDYYYGVRDSEATAIRPAHHPEGTVSYAIGLDVVKQLSWNWMLLTGIEHEFLPAEISDSPIVEDRGLTSINLIVMRLI